jgi:tetratricopeptide (TPR) repeat protein
MAPDFDLGRSVYAWALFDSIKGAEELTENIVTRTRAIVRLTRTESPYARVSPYVPAILNIARLKTRKARYSDVLRWLELLDPAQLRADEYAFTDRGGKDRRLASPLERYHSLKTHALEKLQRWEECLAAAQDALGQCQPLHHDNDIWFARRVAKAKSHLGQPKESMEELTVLAARKSSSFLYYDIAECAWRLGDVPTAAKNCLLALQSPGEIGYKLQCLHLFAQILWERGQQDDARQHLLLYLAYRTERGWHLSNCVKTLATEWAVPETGDPASLLRELESKWREWSDVSEPRRHGTVQTVFPHGRAGFIASADRQRFFFDTRDWKDRRLKPAPGSRVTFRTRPGFDKKRQAATVVACDIRNEDSKAGSAG